MSVLKNIFEVRLVDEIIPSHKRSLSCYFKDSFYAIISATRKGAWNTMSPLPSHAKLLFFSNHFALLGWVCDMKFLYLVYTDLLYFSIYSWSNAMDKRWKLCATLANLLKALAFLYTLDFMKPMINVIRDYNEQCH